MSALASIVIFVGLLVVPLGLLVFSSYRRSRCPACGERKRLRSTGSTRGQATSFLQQNRRLGTLNYQDSYECLTCGRHFQVVRRVALRSNGKAH